MSLLAAAGVLGHDDGPRYVAPQGEDIGDCALPVRPCRTIAYAESVGGKGSEVRVARGVFALRTADEVFYLSSGLLNARGGYDRLDNFLHQEPARNQTVLTGVPVEHASALRARGFHVIVDRKGLYDRRAERIAALQATHAAMVSSGGAAPCRDGAAGRFPCSGIDLLGHLAFNDAAASNTVNDLWGFRDLNTEREYALLGLRDGVVVIDVTDPRRPVAVARVEGARSGWRDAKVMQRYDRSAGRWHAYAYVSVEAANPGGLTVIDLGGLPNEVSSKADIADVGRAHNLQLGNVDLGTGVPVGHRPPLLQVLGGYPGAFRGYDLSEPENPQAVAGKAGATNSAYSHDAAPFVVHDERAAACAGGAPCEILIDFNEGSTVLWDLSDRTAPVVLAEFAYPDVAYVHSGWPTEDGRYLAVHDEFDELEGAPTRVRFFDLADLTAPTLASVWEGTTGATDHNGYARGNRYYLSNYARGLTVLDITDPAAPHEVGFFDSYPLNDGTGYDGAWGVYPFLPSGWVLLSDRAGGLYVLDDRTRTSAAGVLAFAARAFGGAEGGTAEIRVQRTGGTAGAVSVAYAIHPGSTDAADLTHGTGTLTWPDGDGTERVVRVALLADTEAEGIERALLRLRNPQGGAALGAFGSAALFVGDAATAAVGFAATDVRVDESSGRVVLTVSRRGTPVGAVSAELEIRPGTAAADGDFAAREVERLVWEDGDATARTVVVDLVADDVDEPFEYFQAVLRSAAGAELEDRIATVWIAGQTGADEPPTFEVAFDATDISEGGSAMLEVSLLGAATLVVAQTLKLAWSGTADASDHDGPAALELAAGAASATVAVTALDDEDDEPAETLTVTASYAAAVVVGSATLTIAPSDPPQATVAAVSPSVAEGAPMSFALALSHAPRSAEELTVSVLVSETGSAILGDPPTAVTFAAGATAATLTIGTEDDAVVEEASTVTVSLAAGEGYVLGSAAAAETEVTSDDAATFSASFEPASIAERDSTTLTLAITNAVTFATSRRIVLGGSGTAAADDYRVEPAPMVLAAGSSAASATVTALLDTFAEAEETLTLTASLDGETIGAATVTIAANDAATLSALRLTDVDIGPFAPATTSYAATVRNRVASTTVEAAATDAAATVEIADADGSTTGTSRTSALAEGVNRIAVTVTGHGGTPSHTYTVSVTRNALVFGQRVPERDLRIASGQTPTGLWSDGETMWVLDRDRGRVTRYALADGAALEGGAIALSGPYTVPVGLWSDGATLWVSDYGGTVQAYLLATGVRDDAKDLDPRKLSAAGNGSPTGLWSDGVTAWVGDYGDGRAHAYRLSDGAATAGGIDLRSGDVGVLQPGGLWSDGETLLASDWQRGVVRGYALADGARRPAFDLGAQSSENTHAAGLWSDGETLWVADDMDGKVRAYEAVGLLATGSQEEPPPVVTVAASPAAVAEGAAANFTLTLDAPAPAPDGLSVSVSVTETGSTLSGTPPSSVTFAADATEATLSVATENDRVVEEPSTVTATLAAADGYALGDPSAAEMEVADNDEAAFAARFEPAEVEEGDGATLTLEIANGVTFAAERTLSLAWSGTASAADHDGPASLVLAAGASSVAATVTATDDADAEAAETLTATAALDGESIASAVLTIAASDAPPAADAALSALTLSGIALAFEGDVLDYAVEAPAEMSSTTVTATPSDPQADVAVTPADADAAAGHQVSLAVGVTTIAVTVTAEDGTTTRSYSVAVTRPRPTLDFEGLSAAGNGMPRGIWSDGDTLWVVDQRDRQLYAYSMATGLRQPQRDRATGAPGWPQGIWSDGETTWVLDSGRNEARAYRQSDWRRRGSRDIALAAGNDLATGAWGDGATLWVAQADDGRAYAYSLAYGTRDAAQDIDLGPEAGMLTTALWSGDGWRFLAGRGGRAELRGHTASGREASADLALAADNKYPAGMWSDGATLWVSDQGSDKVHAYALAAKTPNATLTVLRVEGVHVGVYAPGRTAYAATVPHGTATATVTVTAWPAQGAAVSYDVADADPDAAGHQLELDVGATRIGVTATAADGTSRTYAVTLTRLAAGQTRPLTASFEDVPARHDGEPFGFELRFSEPPALGYRALRDEALVITGGTVTRVRRLTPGSNAGWAVTVAPDGGGDVELSLAAERVCGAAGAVCTADGRRLSAAVRATVSGPEPAATDEPADDGGEDTGAADEDGSQGGAVEPRTPTLSVADAAADEGGTLGFAVTLAHGGAATVTVDYATADGTATAGDDYASTSGTLTFDAGETSKTVSVATLDDAVQEDAETVALALSNVSPGVAIEDDTATGTIAASDGVTAWFESVPAEHDGSTTFLLQLVLSEDVPGLSYQVVRNDMLSIENGTRESAPRTVAGRNDRWDVYVAPASTAAVTVTVNDGVPLPGGRTLQGGAQATVSGPAPVSAVVDGGVLTLTWPRDRDGFGAPYPSDYAVAVDGAPRAVATATLAGRRVTLLLPAPVGPDAAVTVGYLGSAMHPLADATGTLRSAPWFDLPAINATGTMDALATGAPAPLRPADPFAAAGAVTLDASGYGLDDLARLSGLTALERLDASDNALADLGPLSGLASLREVDLSGNRIVDVSALAGLYGLERLDLSGNRIADAGPLAGLPNLTVLLLDGNPLADAGPLVHLGRLENLGLAHTRIRDVSALADLWSLRRLDLGGLGIADLSPLGDVDTLVWVRLPGHTVGADATLGRLTRLRWVWRGDETPLIRQALPL